jgi:hypothetical protein
VEDSETTDKETSKTRKDAHGEDADKSAGKAAKEH